MPSVHGYGYFMAVLLVGFGILYKFAENQSRYFGVTLASVQADNHRLGPEFMSSDVLAIDIADAIKSVGKSCFQTRTLFDFDR